jgi:hypothetical protein
VVEQEVELDQQEQVEQADIEHLFQVELKQQVFIIQEKVFQ